MRLWSKDFWVYKRFAPDEEAALKKEREMLRPDTVTQHLQSAYKDKCDYNQFANAKSYVSDIFNETEREHSIRQWLEQAKSQSQKKPKLSISRNNKEISL